MTSQIAPFRNYVNESDAIVFLMVRVYIPESNQPGRLFLYGLSEGSPIGMFGMNVSLSREHVGFAVDEDLNYALSARDLGGANRLAWPVRLTVGESCRLQADDVESNREHDLSVTTATRERIEEWLDDCEMTE
jgi:hypothetical protein